MTTATPFDVHNADSASRGAAPSLVRLVRTELLKLATTRLWWGLLILGIVLVAVYAALIAGISGSNFGNQPSNTEGPEVPATLRTIYGFALSIGYLIPLIMGIIGMTGEYRHQTITSSLLAVPRRARLVAAKLVTYLLVGFAYGAVFVVAAIAAGGITLALRGYPLGLGAEGVLRTLLLSILGCGVWAVFGLGLGTLIRNQVAALIVALASQLLVEQLVVFGLNQISGGGTVAQFFPSAASSAIIAGSTGGLELQLLPWWGGTLLLTAYGLVFAVLGILLTTRRDVT